MNKMNLSGLALVCAVCLGIMSGTAGVTTQPVQARIAVVDFKAVGDVGITEAGAAVAELLLPRFNSQRYQLVERTQLASILSEHDLTIAQVVANPRLLEGKKINGVRYLVLGSVVRFGDLSISARMVDVASGDITQTAEVSAASAKGLQDAMGELAGILQMTPEQKRAYLAKRPATRQQPQKQEKPQPAAKPDRVDRSPAPHARRPMEPRPMGPRPGSMHSAGPQTVLAFTIPNPRNAGRRGRLGGRARHMAGRNGPMARRPAARERIRKAVMREKYARSHGPKDAAGAVPAHEDRKRFRLTAAGMREPQRRGLKNIDLLRHVDPQRDRLSGQWRRTEAGLWMKPGARARLMLPIVPEGSYHLATAFTMRRGGTFGFNLPLNGGATTLMISAADKGEPGSIRVHKRPDSKAYVIREPLNVPMVGTRRKMAIRVMAGPDEAHVAVLLDGRCVLEWMGPKSQLLPMDKAAMPKECIGLGNQNTGVMFHALHLRMVDGTVRRLDGIPAGTTNARR